MDFSGNRGAPRHPTIGSKLRSWSSPRACCTISSSRACDYLSRYSNSGSSWTSADSFNVDDSQSTYIIGDNNDTWDHSWTWDEMSNATFRVRITNVADDSKTDFRLDAVAINVFYADTSSSVNHLGPCDWAVQQADAAKALGIQVFTIGWGVSSSNKCSQDSTSSPYYNMSAANFLRLLATDDAHFYNEPKHTDLDPIFNAIGGLLTQGTRLIQ